MAVETVSRRARMRASIAPFLSFFSGPFARLNLEPDVANFAVGNPQEPPMPAYVAALQRQIEPRNKDCSPTSSRSRNRSGSSPTRLPAAPGCRGIPTTWP